MLYMYMLGPVCTVICRIWPCVQTIERYDHEIKLVGPRLGSLALFLLSTSVLILGSFMPTFEVVLPVTRIAGRYSHA